MLFTRVEKTNGNITKTLRFRNNVVEKDSSQCWLNKGIANKQNVELKDFGTFLRSLTPKQALIHGIHKQPSIGIRSAAHYQHEPGTTTRTRDQFSFVKRGSAFFDYDPPNIETAFSYLKYMKILGSIFPAINEMAYVWTPSTSSCIYKDGNELVPAHGGYHIYFEAQNTHDLPRFAKVLFKKLWIAGHGYIFITKNGQMFPRTLIDINVFQPERLDFAAGAICEDGLEQKLPTPVYIKGNVLDTSLLLDLTEQEEEAYNRAEKLHKVYNAAQAHKTALQYKQQAIEKLVESGLQDFEATLLVMNRLQQKLTGNDLLEFDQLGTVTVDKVLNDLPKYDKSSLRDPLEPEYGERKAIVYANLDSESDPVIFSQAHGGRTFTLHVTDSASLAIHKAALMPTAQYEATRKTTAKDIGFRNSTFDDEVVKLKKQNQQDEQDTEELQKTAKYLLFETLEPWPKEVTGDELLQEILNLIKQYVVLSDDAAVACALWTLTAYCYDSFPVMPMLSITSPEKRCGKSTLARILQSSVTRSELLVNITAAALYRLIDKYNPILFIDEADTFMKDNEALRGILNGGHERDGHAIRCEGDTHEVQFYSTWGPKAIFAINKLPETIEDRSVSITLTRRLIEEEEVAKIPLEIKANNSDLRRKCIKWHCHNAEILRNLDQKALDVPNVQNDRAEDNWYPLLCVADTAGASWGMRARKAMHTIELGEVIEDLSEGTQLLQDIRTIFMANQFSRLRSIDIVTALNNLEESPWGTIEEHSRPLSANGLKRRLKPYGLTPRVMRMQPIGNTARGYAFTDFELAFEKFLAAPENPENAETLL